MNNGRFQGVSEQALQPLTSIIGSGNDFDA
jgi:hypothetical protein